MKKDFSPRDVRVIFPRLPLASLAGGLLLLSGGLAARPVHADTTISTAQTPTYTATPSGNNYFVDSGATFDGGSGNGFYGEPGTNVTVQSGSPAPEFNNNVLNGMETAGTVVVNGGGFTDNGSTTQGSDDSGLQADSGANVTINNGTFETNGFHASLPTTFTAISDGNGVEADDATVTVEGGVFNDNGSFGLLAQDGAQVTLSASAEFDLNGDEQVQYGGFGVGAFGAATTLNAEEGYYDDNVNGGLFADAATVNISSGTFDSNGNYGAWVNDGAQLTVSEAGGVPAPSFDNNLTGIGLEVDENDVNNNAPATATVANITAGDFTGNGLDGLRTQGGATVNISGSTQTSLSGATVPSLLAFDGGSTGSQVNGLEDDNSTVNISAGQFNSNHDDGVYFTGGALTISNSTVAGVSDPTFDNNGYVGLNVAVGSTPPVTISAGQFNNNGVDGVQITNAGSALIEANGVSSDPTFNSNGNNGLAVVDDSSATITAGGFNGNGTSSMSGPVANSDGVYVDSSSTLKINTDENNSPGDAAHFDSNVRSGVEVYGVAGITDGTFDSNDEYGLAVGLDGSVTVYQDPTSGHTPTFDGNLESGAGDFGGTLNVSAGTFDSNTYDGLYVGTFPATQNNPITPATATISANLPGSADPVFENNGTNGVEVEDSSLTVTAGTFGAQNAENGNDGLYVGDGSTVNIDTDNANNPGDSATFEYNAVNGADVEGNSAAFITDGLFENNTDNGNPLGGSGYGLAANNSSVTITPDASGHTPSFDDNNFGINAGDSTINISGGDYSGNVYDGVLTSSTGSINIFADPTTGDIGTFENNGASGLQTAFGTVTTITAGTFTGNSNAGVTADNGGNVLIEADPTGDTPTFDANSVAGLQSDGSTVTITAGDFSSNIPGSIPGSGPGDGVYAFDGSIIKINTDENHAPGDFATFDNNSAYGIDINDSTATITDGTFNGNTLQGLSAENGSTLNITSDPTSLDTPTFDDDGLSPPNAPGFVYDGAHIDDSMATITAGTFSDNGANGIYITDGSTVNINADATLHNNGIGTDYAVFQSNGAGHGYNGAEVGNTVSTSPTTTVNITAGEFGDDSGTTYAQGNSGNASSGLFAFDGSQINIFQDTADLSARPTFDGNGADGLLLEPLSSSAVAPTATISAGDFSYNGTDGLSASGGTTVTINANAPGGSGDPTFDNNGNHGAEIDESTATVTGGDFNNNAHDGLVASAGSTVTVETGNSTPGGTPTATFATFAGNTDGLAALGTNGNTPGAIVNVSDGFFDGNSDAGLVAYGGSTVTIGSDALGIASANQPQFFGNVNAQMEAIYGATVYVTDANFNDFGVNFSSPGVTEAPGVYIDSLSTVYLNGDPNHSEGIVAYDNYNAITNNGTANITAGSYNTNYNDGVYGGSGSTTNIGSDALGNASFDSNGLAGAETAGMLNISSGQFNSNTQDGVLADSGATVNITPDTVANNEPLFESNHDGLLAAGGTVNISDGLFGTNTADGALGEFGSTININSVYETSLSNFFFPTFSGNGANGLETAGTANVNAGNFINNTGDGVLGDSSSTINVNTSQYNIADFGGNVNGLETAGTANINTGQFNGNGTDGVLGDFGSTINIHDSSFTPEFEGNGNGLEAFDSTVNITAGQFTGNSNGMYLTNATSLGSTVTIGTDTDGATPSFDDNTNNGASIEGGDGATTGTISAGDFSHNDDDGLFVTDNANVSISDGTFDDNGLAGPGNDGVHVSSAFGLTALPSTLTVSGGDFSGNLTDGVNVDAGSTANISGGTFNGRPAGATSGQVQQNGLETAGTATITGGTFSGNSNDGVLANSGATVNVNGSSSPASFTGNTQNGLGATGATVNITDGTFGAPSGSATGGNGVTGLYATNGSSVTIGPDSNGDTPTFDGNGYFGVEDYDSTTNVTAGTFDSNGFEGLLATNVNTGGVSQVTIGADSTTGDTPTFDDNSNNGISIEAGNGTTTADITAGQFENNVHNGMFDTDGANVTIGTDAMGDTPSFDDNGKDGIHVSSSNDGFNAPAAPSMLTVSGGDFSGNFNDGVLVDAGSKANVTGGTFNGRPAGATSGQVQQNGMEVAGTATISGATFSGNSNDGVKGDAGSNITVNDPPSFDNNLGNGLETAGTATINAGDFSDNGLDGLLADPAAMLTVNGGTFDGNTDYGIGATGGANGATADVYLYDGLFSNDGLGDLDSINDATIYVYGSDLGFAQTLNGPVDYTNTDPYASGYVVGDFGGQQTDLSYNTATGGTIVLQNSGQTAVPEASPLALMTLPLGILSFLRARRRTRKGPLPQ